MLSIEKKPRFENDIIKYEFRSFLPSNPNALNKSDIIEIVVQHQDAITATYDSKLYIEGKLNEIIPIPTPPQQLPPAETERPPVPVDVSHVKFIQNAFMYLFSEMQFLLNGEELETVRDPGILTTIKTLLLSDDYETLETAGWLSKMDGENEQPITYNKTTKQFYCEIPLKFIFAFARDYGKVFMNMRQCLKLTRSHVDTDVYKSDEENRSATIELNKIEWRIPFVHVSVNLKLKFMKELSSNRAIDIWFRKFEIVELPTLNKTTNDSWIVKTSVDTIKYVFVAFQTDRRWKNSKDSSGFDHCNINNMRVFLNSNAYPLENLNLDIANGNYVRAYEMYQNIFESFHGRSRTGKPPLDYRNFLEHFLFAFDLSKQDESVKPSITDLKIEMNARSPFGENTRAYCVIVSDAIVEYTPLSGIVRKIL